MSFKPESVTLENMFKDIHIIEELLRIFVAHETGLTQTLNILHQTIAVVERSYEED